MLEKNFELLKKSDPAALGKIHAQYNRRIFWLGRKIIDDEFIVENLVQDTFLKLWNYREKIEDPMHILFFLRFVMKRSCYEHYYKPRNQFFRTTVSSFEKYENYKDYLAGYDPADSVVNLQDQDSQQELFDQLNKVLPLIRPERRNLINLCLKYGFRYKEIAQVTGKGIRETVNEVQRAVEDIKKIVDRRTVLERKKEKAESEYKVQTMSERQSQVLKLRIEMKCSFAAIARELNLTQKEVQEEFIAAYKFTNQHQNQSV
ncbi:RNA polymerase sigma factor [Paenimyroides baculatum]|uniref:Sigma-70 family RNA polymerase sigma factor n=1 Tax=Paenimyroides baculatum TaxID=2608000 RepID=A0A5M6CKR3_9FLAO|nr:sigma-70 family RNA polymerase sigma factor [Paenimyroides baculatum]KAA5535791.1 sigma-70 family RNA polymerase sigma factor [Paenimyroides baculatum]